MTVDPEALRAIVTPLVVPLGLSLYDIELTGSGRARLVRISVFRPDGEGLDLDALADATHAVERAVEQAIDGAFQLEVSSPGLERKLARPEHFQSAVGSEVSVKYRDDAGVATRVRGRLTEVAEADGDSASGTITIVDEQAHELVIARDAIVGARTVFEWGPAPRPGRGPAGAHARVRAGDRPKEATRS
ncbi:MAG TPA: ribosome maturation factor RimP [Acidimicrobiia bacterium]|jgi:ribosome maturation factor RimP